MESPDNSLMRPFRKKSAVILGMAVTIFLQAIVSIALYGYSHTVPSALLNSDFVRLLLPAIVSAGVIGTILSLVLQLGWAAASFTAAVLSGVTWIVALTIAINKFGA